jgi:hypothetical protein
MKVSQSFSLTDSKKWWRKTENSAESFAFKISSPEISAFG